MTVTMEKIKELRELTGAGVLDCKQTLESTGGDLEQAVEILREKGLAAAAKKADREAADGRVEAYVHPGNKLVAVVVVNCETDFVARTQDFIDFCHDLAMQVAAANPLWISREAVPDEVLEEEKKDFADEVEGKPEHIVERIIEGKLSKFYQQHCLLDQPFIKDEDSTIQQLLTDAIARMGENIVIARFERLSIDR